LAEVFFGGGRVGFGLSFVEGAAAAEQLIDVLLAGVTAVRAPFSRVGRG
jgi:hypothetical protein